MATFPKLIVFDLDYTLWPFFVDTHYCMPFKCNSEGIVVDHMGEQVPYFPEVPEVLEKLSSLNIDLAIASRTSEIEGAYQLVELFGWKNYFKYTEIYPGRKTNHFKQFKKNSGYDYSDMLFFDDEERNIVDVSACKVTCVLVGNGVNIKEMTRGLEKYRSK